MREFYSALREGVPTAEALRRSQRHVRDLSVRELASWCEAERREAADTCNQNLVNRLELDLAHADYLGRDFAAALGRYEAIARRGGIPEAEAGASCTAVAPCAIRSRRTTPAVRTSAPTTGHPSC